MSTATYKAWTACHTVWHRLRPSEQDILSAYYAEPRSYASAQQAVDAYAQQAHISPDYAWQVISRACQLAAIERGIADHTDERNSEQ